MGETEQIIGRSNIAINIDIDINIDNPVLKSTIRLLNVLKRASCKFFFFLTLILFLIFKGNIYIHADLVDRVYYSSYVHMQVCR
jgi:hypothetical protein